MVSFFFCMVGGAILGFILTNLLLEKKIGKMLYVSLILIGVTVVMILGALLERVMM